MHVTFDQQHIFQIMYGMRHESWDEVIVQPPNDTPQSVAQKYVGLQRCVSKRAKVSVFSSYVVGRCSEKSLCRVGPADHDWCADCLKS